MDTSQVSAEKQKEERRTNWSFQNWKIQLSKFKTQWMSSTVEFRWERRDLMSSKLVQYKWWNLINREGKKNRALVREHEGTSTAWPDLHATGVSEGARRRRAVWKIIWRSHGWKLPKLEEKHKLMNWRNSANPAKNSPPKSTPKRITVKLLKVKENNLESSQREKMHYLKEF